MHPLRVFDEAPLDHILPANLPEALGVRDLGLAAKLASSRLLRSEVNQRILIRLPAAPKTLSPASAAFFANLVMESAESLARLCRVTAVLINHKSILATTSGAVLTEIAAWCGDQALILELPDIRFPAFEALQVLNHASAEALESYSLNVRGRLIGVLPPAYRARLKLRLAPEDFPEPLAFAPGDPDEGCFLRYVALAREHCNAKG